MQIIDLSQPLYDGCPNCPAHPPVKMSVIGKHAPGGDRFGNTWHMEMLQFASHTGSHVDAPLHKVPGGRSTDDVPLESWMGRARIVDVRGIEANGRITAEMLAEKMPGEIEGEWVLLATGFGDKRGHTREWLHEPPVLGHDGATWLVEKRVRGVGIDHYSIGDGGTHAILLGGGRDAVDAGRAVLIVEELHFPEEVFALKQPAEFWCLPINLRAHSGAPCRPVLILR